MKETDASQPLAVAEMRNLRSRPMCEPAFADFLCRKSLLTAGTIEILKGGRG